jgi:acetyltransferase
MIMNSFFNPASIAVIGVSGTPSNMGKIIVENLEQFHYKGNIYPVGPKAGYVGNKKIFSNLDEIEEVPELAVILVPADKVPFIIKECGSKGIKHCIVETGGFSEFSIGRKNLEKEIRDTAGHFKMKLAGPNCFGVINLLKGVVLPFFILNPDYMKTGRVSLISQSGGVFYDACMNSSCENIGLCKLISIGNKLMVNENECLEYLINDPETDVIGLYLEDFADGRRFMELAASTDKPIVLLKGNISSAGREIAQFHTTALAGDNEVATAAMEQAGVTVVRNMQDMLDCLKIFSMALMKGKRLAIISRSGGHSVLSADSSSRYGFELTRFSDEFFSNVRAKKLNVIQTTNPLDIGDVYDLDAYTGILEMALKEAGVDGVVFVITYSSESDGKKVQRFIRNAAGLSFSMKKPVALCVATNRREWFDIREAADFPIFSDSDLAIRALSASLEHFQRKTELKRQVIKKTPAIKRAAGNTLSLNVFALLEKYGLRVAEYAYVKDVNEAVKAANIIGYPVALKDASPLITHKTEKKGVILNLATPETLKKAMNEIDTEEYLIQKMYPPALEIIIGVKFDREFGHVILLGLGGIYVELFRNTTIRILPIDKDMAGEMIERLSGSAILKGYRGERHLDIESLKDALSNLSRLINEYPEIENIDLNPVIVLERGNGSVILDAKIKFKTT